jgi:hypothetical protein
MPPQDMGGFQQQQMQQQFEGPPGGMNDDEDMDGMDNGGQPTEHREEQDQEMEDDHPLADPHPTVYVNNINEKIRGEKLRRGLRQVFAPFGKIRKISVRKGIKSHGQVCGIAVTVVMWCVCGRWLPLYKASSDVVAPATLNPCQTPRRFYTELAVLCAMTPGFHCVQQHQLGHGGGGAGKGTHTSSVAST